ncbi:MAG: 4Fe-4S dicluster domain-containing protein, partial [Candidatus Omnitrophica bacterium]|nr:4Fe-4S dicluster domain-containing protein [Candidatus Omnitrophota bacterium]
EVLENGKPSTWADLAGMLSAKKKEIESSRGAGLRFLTEASSSPSRARLKAMILSKLPEAKWFEYEPVSSDNVRLGTRIAFGADYRPQYDLSKALAILDLEADLLGADSASSRNARGFVAGRDPESHHFNRLYSIESGYSTTGAQADHRFAVRSSEIHGLLAQLASVLQAEGLSVQGESASILEAASSAAPETDYEFLPAIARDLLANKGHSIIAVGPNQSPRTHALAFALNDLLGNLGQTLTLTEEPDNGRPGYIEGLKELTDEMTAGSVDTLFVLGGNPVYDSPSDFKFSEALAKVKTSIHLSQFADETSLKSTWHIPRAHYLETWSDGRLYDGTISAGQPLIAPLYDGKSDLELLAFLVIGEFPSGYAIVQRTFRDYSSGDFETAWREFLDNGMLADTAYPAAEVSLDAASVADSLRDFEVPESQGIELAFAPHPSVYDGRFANNGWLQEVPDYLTKLTWDNAAIVSFADAKKLGVEYGDLIRIETNGGSIELPVCILPGQAAGSIVAHLGYGRTAAGRVGNNLGFDTYKIRTSEAPYFVCGVNVKKTGGAYPLSSTQDHYAIDPNGSGKNSLEELGQNEIERRIDHLIKEQTVEEFQHHAGDAHTGGEHHGDEHSHHPPIESPWTEWEYPDLKWGMAIDLNKCIGCNGCVLACQSENNIPVVGKEQVARGREMHWLRIDRYFHGEPEVAQVAHQPLTCHHCENAPCEQVCPVGATMHDHDGLNVMVYNRCIGTRYCSNNCPYKVRRFNWFHFTKNYTEVEQMRFNPEVTIRSRGVMEKCTYCTQRIQSAKIDARNENREIADGEVRTACQQACPTNAIEFGNLNDPNSRVAKLQKDKRAYSVLEELNVKPRTKYLTRLRNPNPELLEA